MAEKRRALFSQIMVAKSLCSCGHSGDGEPGDHGPLDGHGACRVPGCDCKHFIWAGYLSHIEDMLDAVTV